MQSCASVPARLVSRPCDDFVLQPLPSPRPDTLGVVIVGKVRIELPEYRIRGLCRMVFSPAAGLRIDFSHSSLFGAVREDATLLLGDSLTIFDRESGRIFGPDSSLAMLRESVGAPIGPADVVQALLLAVPACAELDEPRLEKKGDLWTLQALWRGRRLEVKGGDGEGTRSSRECFAGVGRCFLIDYMYARGSKVGAYPQWIRVSREGTGEWVTLEVSSVAVVPVSTFDFAIERPAAE
jgi:hypothetical protein